MKKLLVSIAILTFSVISLPNTCFAGVCRAVDVDNEALLENGYRIWFGKNIFNWRRIHVTTPEGRFIKRRYKKLKYGNCQGASEIYYYKSKKLAFLVHINYAPSEVFPGKIYASYAKLIDLKMDEYGCWEWDYEKSTTYQDLICDGSIY